MIQPRLGSVEEWKFINNKNDEHPIHIHANDFQVMHYYDAIICANRKVPLAELYAAGSKEGDRFDVIRKAYLSPRSVGFNVHGVRVVVHRVTGEIMALQSVHGADIGRLINPMQCRGQLDGAIAMGFGWALYEKMVYDANGAMVNAALRDYRIPAFADVPQRDLFRRHL